MPSNFTKSYTCFDWKLTSWPTLVLYLGIIFVSHTLLSFNYFFMTGTSLLIDLPTRVEVNDAWLNLLYFFWTSANYLPVFFFSLGGLLFLSLTPRPASFLWSLGLVLFVFYCFECSDLLALNMNPFSIDLTRTEINLLLTNSLNKYHPGLFFLSVLGLFTAINSQFFNFYRTRAFCFNYVALSLPTSMLSFTLFNIIALTLGSWWAFQEGTWGGWWNWDASEVLGLLVGVFGVFMLHQSLVWSSMQRVFVQLNLLGVLFLLSYFFTQLNFELISHNFTPIFLLFFTKNTFFLEVEGVLLLVFVIQLGSLYKAHTSLLLWGGPRTWTERGSRFRWLQIGLLWGVIWVGLGLSFGPLLNHFCWTYLSLNSLGYLLRVSLLIYLFLFGLVLGFTSRQLYMFPPLLLSVVTQWYAILLLLPLTLTPRWGLVTFVHVFLTLFVVVNVLSYALPFVEWYPWLRVRDVQYVTQMLALMQTNYTCHNTIVEVVDFYSWQYQTTQIMWNAWYGSNSSSVHSFALLLTPGGCSNLYNVAWGWWSLFLLIETNLVHTLLDLCLIIVVSVVVLVQRRWIVRFAW